jgi:succinate-semialdehyde dehydrogenase
MSAYAYDTWEEAVAIANANLNVEGKGHSVSIQSNNKEHIEYAGEVLPVSRVLINQICATQNGGAFSNSLSPTTTLGCGSWGNNSISENLSYYHLYNITRVAYEKEGWSQPSDEEIWAK